MTCEEFPLRVLEYESGLVHATRTKKHTYKPFIEEHAACGRWCDDPKRYKGVEITAQVTCIDCLALENP